MATFIIADDSRPQRLWIRECLQRAGHVILGEASHGEAAVDLCREHHPDFVTMDINMQPMPGSEAAQIIAREKLAGRVLVFTLNVQNSVVDPLKAVGCTVWFKPFHSKERFLNNLEPLLHG